MLVVVTDMMQNRQESQHKYVNICTIENELSGYCCQWSFTGSMILETSHFLRVTGIRISLFKELSNTEID